MNAEETYVRINQIIQEAEEVIQSGATTNLLRWAGMSYATLIESGLGLGMAASTVKTAISTHHLTGDYSTYTQVLGALFQAVAIAELKSPASAQGAFIPVGNSFDALAAVGKLLGQSNKSVRIIDPYMDEKALTEFGIMANEEPVAQ